MGKAGRHVRGNHVRLCACGHARFPHEHYRRGSDCALCDCPRWRPVRGAVRELVRRWAAAAGH